MDKRVFFNDFDWIVGETREIAIENYSNMIGYRPDDDNEFRELPLTSSLKMHFDCVYDVEKSGLSVADAINEDAEVDDYYVFEKTLSEWIELYIQTGHDFEAIPLLCSTEY